MSTVQTKAEDGALANTLSSGTPAVKKRSGGALMISLLVTMVVSAVLMFVVEQREIIGALGLVLMLAMIFLKIPIVYSLLVPGLLGMWSINGFRLVDSIFSSAPYGQVASWSLSVIPMFVLMGMLLSATGLTSNLYSAMKQWLWWLPGSLAVGTNAAGAGLAAVSGSTIGTTYALGRVGIPEMLKAGYDRRIALLAVMASGLPGQLIPPSILMLIYAGLVETPIGPQLLAGVIPGLLVASIFGVIFIFLAIFLKNGGRASSSDRVGFGTMVMSLLKAWPVPVLMVVIIGGMYSGVFTATEAGAAAAIVAVFLALGTLVKTKDWRPMRDAVVDTVSTTGMIFFLMIGAMVLSEMLTQTGISTGFAELIMSAGFDRITFLLVLILVYLVLGTGMDTLALMVLTVPVLIPALESLDISLLWFGVFVVLLGELAGLTPPVGVLIYVIHAMVQDPKVNRGVKITLNDVFTSIWWVLPGAVVVLLILIFFPELATWLPDQMAQNTAK